MNRLALAVDVGGTKTFLRLVAQPEGPASREVVADARLENAGVATLDDVIARFLDGPAAAARGSPIGAACLGLAGPVVDGRCELTNLPWTVDAQALAARFDIGTVSMVNDFVVVAHGIDALGEGDIATIHAGREESGGPRVVVGAGTGLGVAFLPWDGTRHVVMPSEAGTIDFSPVNARQDGLLRYWRDRGVKLSHALLLSGRGIVRIAEFLLMSGHATGSPTFLEAFARDGAAAVTAFGLEGRDAAARAALDLFVDIYGQFTGNMALTSLATGGVYVAGGIAPKMAPLLTDGRFATAFLDRANFRPLLESMPVRLVMDERVGLLGAVEIAAAAL